MGKVETLSRIGEVAKELKTRRTTVRYYTNLGLLRPIQKTAGGHFLYNLEDAKKRFERIKKLKQKRFTIEEILEDFGIKKS